MTAADGCRRGLLLSAAFALACAGPQAPELLDLPRADLAQLSPAAQEEFAVGRKAVEAALVSSDDAETLAAALGEQGMRYHAHGLWAAAETCYLNATRVAPEDSGWAHLLGLVYAEQSRLDESAEELERSLDLNPISAPTVVALGEVHAARERPDLAEPLLRGAANIQSTRPRALFALGQLALARGDHAAALGYLQEARQLAPRATVLNAALSQALDGVGEHERAQQIREKAGDVPVPAGDRLLATVHGKADGARVHVAKALEATAAGDLGTALAEFRLAVRADPASVPALAGLGSVLAQRGDFVAAREQFEATLRLEPNHPTANCSLGRLLVRDGDLAGAIRRFELGLDSGAEPIACRLNLAKSLQQAGRHAEAVAHYERLVDLQPGDSAASHGLALVSARLGQWSAAREAVEAGLAAKPQDRLLRQDLIRLMAAAPDESVRDAARALADAQALAKEDSNFLNIEALAMALAGAGRFAEAAQYQQAIIDAVKGAGREDLAARFAPNRALYSAGEPCRQPWPENG